MIYTAENEFFTLGVKEMGAELTSLKSKKTGIEYIWEGNTDIWYGQSPILFPVIGRLLDDKYRLNGKEYSMEKHGIVRKKPFKLVEQTKDSLTFVQSDDESSLKIYPYHFDLYVTFKLNDNGLEVLHKVVNKNDCVMYYSFGAHPGFNCKIGDYLEFDNPQVSVLNEQIDEESLLIDSQVELLKNEKRITIEKNTFDNDALILSGYTDKVISLKSDNHSRVIRFNFDSPVLGIWAKPNAPYVCIEPWWGINDNHDKKADLSEKRGILSLEANSSETFTWSAEITE
ncbi:MAG: aldose 1-epimerase family protein [Ruminococcaceae bacterium]|nr:aldose 1-epimerase family protein [Oscillospiraceae bacterium]